MPAVPVAVPTEVPPRFENPNPFPFTVEQYHRLGELGFFDGRRVELIRGQIVELGPSTPPHATAVGLASDALRPAFAVGFHVRVQQPFRMPGPPPSEPQPDVAVIPGSVRALTAHPTVAALIVEVAEATLFHDMTTTAQTYAEAGVTEYWVLDLVNRQLLVYRDPAPVPGGVAYRTGTAYGPADAVAPLAAPAATVRVADLLP
jgi:Uma2 family endonuclease